MASRAPFSGALTPTEPPILSALASAPSLRALATPDIAAELARLVTPTRPLAHVLQALDELGVKAALASAAGRPWSTERILDLIPSFVYGVRPRAQAPTQRAATPRHEDEVLPPMRERARGVRNGGRALLAALG